MFVVINYSMIFLSITKTHFCLFPFFQGIYLELTGNSLPDEVSQQLKSIESAATLERFIIEKYGKIRNNKKKREIALGVRLKANSFLSFS